MIRPTFRHPLPMGPAGLPLAWLLGPLLLGPVLGTGCGSDAPELRAGSDGGASHPVYLATETPAHDFGEVWEGAVLEHEFVLRTMGTEDLVLRDVGADCGCTVPSLEVADSEEGTRRAYANGTPVPPGKWLFLRVCYDTRGKVGAAPRQVHLMGNTPGGRTNVIVQAKVKRWLLAEPERVDLPELFVDDRTETRFRVTSSEDVPFHLRHSGLGVPEQVGVELTPSEPDEKGRALAWDVRVTLGPNMPRGSHNYPIQLLSDVLNSEAAEEPGAFFAAMPYIGVKVVGVVSVAPGRMTFGMIRDGETVSRTVRVASNDAGFELAEPTVRFEPLRTGEAFPLANTATITKRPVEGANAWDIQLLFEGLDPAIERTFLARLVVETGHPEEPSLQVPITGFRLQTQEPQQPRAR